MELIEVITSTENLNRAYKKVLANKGASGADGITVEELGDYIKENKVKNCSIHQKQNLYANAGAQSIYTQKQWKEKTTGYTNSVGQNHSASHSITNIRYL